MIVPDLTTSLLHDAEQMLQTYRIPMASHALHVYHSVLVTMPRCSLLDVTPETLRSSIPRLASTTEPQWGHMRVRKGHASLVFSVVFSPDGTRIASGSRDGTVRIWDTQTGGQLALFEGHTETVSSVVFSPDGTRIASGSSDKTVRIWDTQTGKQLALLKGHTDTVWSVVFSPHGTRITSGSFDKTVRIWDTQTGGQLAKLRHQYGILSVAYSADMKYLVAHDVMGQEKQWDMNSIGALCARSLATVY
jgi:WD40 repeat protein